MPHTMRVWAPRAHDVSLVVAGADHPMSAAAEGWWTVQAPDSLRSTTGSGSTTTTRSGPTRDPAGSPAGVDGPTRTFDPSCYQWGDAAWTGRRLAGSIIYELHIGTFTPEGTLDAAIGKLDHLVSIGVDMVELLPVNAFSGTHNWGYDGVLWFAVQESYGGPRAYQRFVDACHQRGHRRHPGRRLQPPRRRRQPPAAVRPVPERRPAGSSTWGESHQPGRPRLRRGAPVHPGQRRHVAAATTTSTACGWTPCTRWSTATPCTCSRRSPSRSTRWLAHVRRPLTLIAESDLNDPKLITPREAGGYGLTAQWNDDFHHVMHVALTGETDGYYADFGPMSAIAKVLTKAFFHDGTFSSFRGRDHGRPVDTLITPSWRFIGYSQDHDQVGNRAIGDRLTAQLSADDLAIAAVLVLTGPFTPMLFMGEEWAASTPWAFFTSHPDEDLGEATREGRLEEFARMGWDKELVPGPAGRIDVPELQARLVRTAGPASTPRC